MAQTYRNPDRLWTKSLEQLRIWYVNGSITLAEFERQVALLIEQENH